MRSWILLACTACGGAGRPVPGAGPAAGPGAKAEAARDASGALAITSAAELVAPGIVSSPYSEIRLAASPDGRMVLWGSTDRPGGPGGWDIWLARRAGPEAAFGSPEPAPFDSPANDFDPAFSADGRWLYFFSNRPGGFGGDDLYRAAVTADGFGPAQHLGAEVNTAGDEWAPSPSPDGAMLMFASNRPGAKHDLYAARVAGAGFAQAELLLGTVNTPGADEFDAAFLGDGSAIVFSRSTDVENDPIELYCATRGPAGYGAETRLPDAVNVAGGYTLGPSVDGRERDVLYFSGKRPEASAGKLDVYRVHYALRAPPPAR